jgi:EAL domain-containing protein (putative c-di-GMP-specific phosphodiesterase class I)
VSLQAGAVLEWDLRTAVRSQQFELVYLPRHALRSGELTGFEAQMRWRHPRRGLIASDEFLPVAEEIGLIVPIRLWALREALGLLAKLPSPQRIAINVSPIQLTGEHLLSRLAPMIDGAVLEPSRLELEITETAELAGDRRTRACLSCLRGLGLRLGMDGFGTGYASLSSLMELPFDNIKIEATFIAGLGRCQGSANVVRAVIDMASRRDMSTTAACVDTDEQAAFLRDEGCTEGQGARWSGQLSAAEAVAFCSGDLSRAGWAKHAVTPV